MKNRQLSNELEAMLQRMFGDGLLERILAAYQLEMADKGYGEDEQGYREGSAALSASLSGIQLEKLSHMERLFQENMEFALKSGFSRGVYAGFEQLFDPAPSQNPFQEFVLERVIQQSQPPSRSEYARRKQQAKVLYQALRAQLDSAMGEHLISVYTALDNRLFGIFRYAFYLGGRYVLSVIGEIEPALVPQAARRLLLVQQETYFSYS